MTRGCQINQEENILANIIVPAISPNDTSKNDIVKVRHAIRVSKMFVAFFNALKVIFHSMNNRHFLSNSMNLTWFFPQIFGVVGGCHRIPKLHVPIVIGSYAFRDDSPTRTLNLYDNTLNMPRNSSIQVNSQQLSARYNVYV